MASWDNGGRGVDEVNQIGVAKPSTFFNSFFPTGFGSNSSSTSALPNPPATNTKGKFVGFDSFLFGRQTTANSDTFTSPVATQPPPFGSYQCGGGDHELFRKNSGTGAFQNAQPYGWAGSPFSGNQQFDSQFSIGISAAATTSSPFGNESPSYSSSSSTFGTISSGFRSSTTGPLTRSLVQENSSVNNESVLVPWPSTRSNLGISDIQGTRICSYVPTPEADNIFSSSGSGELTSISAMPFYQEKSHEELRLEDYQLAERTGSSIVNTNSKSSNQHNTSADSVSVFAPFTNSDQGRSGCQGTKCSYEASRFGNESPSYSSSSSTFGTISSGFRSSTTGSSVININSKSSNRHNTSADNVSVFSPFTNSDQGRSGCQGTKWSYETSPFGNESPSYSSSSSTFGTISSGFRSSTTGPFTRSLVQENTSANNVSVFAPSTRSNLGISGVQGTRYCSYATTPVVENDKYYEMVSISAMPFYNEKSHEELRLEDYRLTERTGSSSIINTNSNSSNQHSTSADNVSVFAPFKNSDQGRSGCQGTQSSYETSRVEGNIPVSNATFSLSTVPFNKEKGHEELRSSGDYQFTGKTVGYVTRAESSFSFPVINLSISVSPNLISSSSSSSSTGASSGFRSYNRQQPISFIANPGATEARVTLPIEKYKPDDEDVMAMIPKLKCPEYYTEPSMEDLAANELKRPGFCCKVKDFVIGKHGYGSIKLLGETDVRNLDLESFVQFNNQEVIFCMDKNGKPPVGEGLNKAAEITLLNVNCIDKNTGKQYIDGPKVDKYKQLLMRKTTDQGAEFVSFDPAKGEWKFKVQHF